MRHTCLALLAACHAVDTTRVRVRGEGITLEVVSRADPEQVHLRWFDVEVDPACAVEVGCRSDDDPERLARQLGEGRATPGTVVGFLADTRYTCEITARTGDRSVTATTSFRTDPPAVGTPQLVVEGAGWGGLTLFNTWLAGGGGRDHVLVLADDRGLVRWLLELGDREEVGVEASVWEGRSLLLGGGGGLAPQQRRLGGGMPWSFPGLPTGEFYHHDVVRTPHGTVLGLHTEAHRDHTGRAFDGFRVTERDPDTGAVGFDWGSEPAFEAGFLPRGSGRDPWHANGLAWIDDALGAGVLVSLPGVDRVLRIDANDGRIVWQLGRDLDFALVAGDWFSYQHAPEWRDGRLLLHDNGQDRGASRALELELDQDARIAEITWEWTEPGWYEPIWGEVDRLPDGTVLVTRGHCSFCGAGPGPSRLSIVDPTDGSVDWSLSLVDPGLGVYRSERVPRSLLDLVGDAP